MEYIGIDVRQRESQVCVLDAVGEGRAGASAPHDPGPVRRARWHAAAGPRVARGADRE
jgi:hypothetical protein